MGPASRNKLAQHENEHVGITGRADMKISATTAERRLRLILETAQKYRHQNDQTIAHANQNP